MSESDQNITPTVSRRFSARIAAFVVVFAGIGTYLLFSSFAATPTIATLQAEQMTPLPAGATIISDSTASGGQAVQMTQNGRLTGTVTLPSTATSLSVVAKGSPKCRGGRAQVNLSIDSNSVISGVPTDTSWQSYSASNLSLAAGTHTVNVVFNTSGSNCNRSLYIDVTNFYGPTTPPPAPTVTISATPTSVTAGQASTLTWSSTNASSCTASGSWSGSEPTSGSTSTGALNANSTYNLTCTGAGGTATGSATVNVGTGTTGSGPQTTWATCSSTSFTPESDTLAASQITHVAENRPYNARSYTFGGVTYPGVNSYVPNSTELAAFQSAKDQYGRTPPQQNPYLKYVDGLNGLSNPSTDDLIQWAAHKWGIPEDWLRAQYEHESYWNHWTLGDRHSESAAWFTQFPAWSRVPGSSTDVYESLGLTQEKWRPDNSVGIGTEPLRWKSMAFNIDFQAATVRFYYDNPQGLRSTWGDSSSYVACQQWNSIGGWFSPVPWGNSGQESYISTVQSLLNSRDWTSSSFKSWTLNSTPPGITWN